MYLLAGLSMRWFDIWRFHEMLGLGEDVIEGEIGR